MASDNVNEVGKFLRKTRKDVDFSLTRYHKNIPRIERTRDIFDAEIPFEMAFDTDKNDSTVFLNINFNKPPPVNECKNAECVKIACQSFELAVGNHYVNVDNPYIAETVTVFIDHVPLAASQFEEMGGTELFIQSNSIDPYTATVCYTYSDEDEPCVEDTDCIPDEPKAYLGLARLFYDRFDKMNPQLSRPTGGCGYWGSVDGTIEPTMFLNDFADTGDLGGANVSTEDIFLGGTAGVHWEVLLKFGLEFSSDAVSVDCIANDRLEASGLSTFDVNFNITGRTGTTRNLQINANAEAIDSVAAFSTSWVNNPNGLAITTITMPEDNYYLRLAQLTGFGWVMKVWQVDEVEPAAWTHQLSTLPTPAANTTDTQWKFINLQRINVISLNLFSISVWGDEERGRWNCLPASNGNRAVEGAQWGNEVCFPGDGQPRFDHCSEYTITITGPDNLSSGNAESRQPEVGVTVSFPFFGGGVGDGLVAHFNQEMVSSYTSAAIGTLHYEMEARITGNGQWSGIPVTMQFYQHDLDDEEPPEIEGLPSVGLLYTHSTGTINGSYIPIEFDLNPINGRIQWSVACPNPHEVAALLPKADNGFLSPPTSTIRMDIKNIRIFADGNLLCTAHNGCYETEDQLNLRCGEVTYDFEGENLPQYCNTFPTSGAAQADIDFFTTPEGLGVEFDRDIGTAVTFEDGEATITWRARSSEDVSDENRCRFTTIGPKAIHDDRGTTTAAVDITLPSPFPCEESVEASFEIYVPRLIAAPDWVTTTGSAVVGQTRTPQWFLEWGDSGQAAGWYEIDSENGFQDTFSNSITPFLSTGNVAITAATWWTIKFISDGATKATKLWPSSDPEPSTYFHSGIPTFTGSTPTGFYISIGYADFIDDDFYIKVRNFQSRVI